MQAAAKKLKRHLRQVLQDEPKHGKDYMKDTGCNQRKAVNQHGIHQDGKKQELWANLHVRDSTSLHAHCIENGTCLLSCLCAHGVFWLLSSQRPCFRKLQARVSDARRQHVCSIVAFTGLEGEAAEECCELLSKLWLERFDSPGPFKVYISHMARLLVQHVRGYVTADLAAEMELTRFDSARDGIVLEMSRVMNFGKLSTQAWQLLQVFNILHHNMRTVPSPPKGFSVEYHVIVVCEVREEGTQRFRIPVAVLIFGNVTVKAARKNSFIYSHFLLTRASRQVWASRFSMICMILY